MTWKIIKRFSNYEQQVKTVKDGDYLHLKSGMMVFTSNEIPGTFTIIGAEIDDAVGIVREGRTTVSEATIIRGRGEFYIEPFSDTGLASILGFHYNAQESWEKVILREKEVSGLFLLHPHSALERMR